MSVFIFACLRVRVYKPHAHEHNCVCATCMRGPLSLCYCSVYFGTKSPVSTHDQLAIKPTGYTPSSKRRAYTQEILPKHNGRRIGQGTKHSTPHGHSPTAHCRWLERGMATPAGNCPLDTPLDVSPTVACLRVLRYQRLRPTCPTRGMASLLLAREQPRPRTHMSLPGKTCIRSLAQMSPSILPTSTLSISSVTGWWIRWRPFTGSNS